MLGHQLLERMDAALLHVVPGKSVVVRGDWTSRRRISNQLEVVDHIWAARLSSTSAFTGMALLCTRSGVYWAKAAHVSVEISAPWKQGARFV
jgi:hypothetical protein